MTVRRARSSNVRPAYAYRKRRSPILLLIAALALGGVVLIGVFGADATAGTSSLWSEKAKPRFTSTRDQHSVEVGVKFRARAAGQVLGIKFFKGAPNTGTHEGSLWGPDGHELARITFQDETAKGWQTAIFPTPVTIVEGTTYVVSYFAPHGHYALDRGYFHSSRQSGDGVLYAPKNAGVYAYGPAKSFPTASHRASNYWVDVIFASNSANAPAAPTDLRAFNNGGAISLTWAASPAATVAKYNVIRDGAVIGSTDGTSYDDKAIEAGRLYSYQVQSVSPSGGMSSPTSAISIRSSGAGVPPPTATPTPSASATATPPPSPGQTPGDPGGGGGGPVIGTGCTTFSAGSTAASCGFPVAANTGVPKTVTLKAQETTGSSGMIISKDGTVVEGRNIKGYLDVRADNVIIRNNQLTITSWSGIKIASGVTGLKILHNKIVGAPAGGAQTDYGINQSHGGSVEVAFNDISGFKDGIVGDSLNVHDNYVHDLRIYSGAHTQDLYVYCGGTGVTAQHNTFINQTVRGSDGSGPTAAIYIAPDCSGQRNHRIEGNWLSGGAFTVYGGDSGATNIKLLNNVFSTEAYNGQGAIYGPIAYWFNNSGNVASGNVWGNGSKAGSPVTP